MIAHLLYCFLSQFPSPFHSFSYHFLLTIYISLKLLICLKDEVFFLFGLDPSIQVIQAQGDPSPRPPNPIEAHLCGLIGRVHVCLYLLPGRSFLIGCLEPSGSPLKAYTQAGSFIGCEQCWVLVYLTYMWSPGQRGLQLLSAAMAAKSLSLLHCLYLMLVLLLQQGTFFGLKPLLLRWGGGKGERKLLRMNIFSIDVRDV